MDNQPSPIERIEANAQFVVDLAHSQFNLELAHDRDAVVWLDDYIEAQHQQGDHALHDQLADVLGSFLGQCIVRTHGGHWHETDGQWAIVFSPDNAAYPMEKVRKHLAHGRAEGEAVLSFFDAIPALFGQDASSDKTTPCPMKEWCWTGAMRRLFHR